MALLQECPRCKTRLSFKYQLEVKDGEEVKKSCAITKTIKFLIPIQA